MKDAKNKALEKAKSQKHHYKLLASMEGSSSRKKYYKGKIKEYARQLKENHKDFELNRGT